MTQPYQMVFTDRLPSAPHQYDRSEEQQFRRTVELGKVPVLAPLLHADTHKLGGTDQIDLTGLPGVTRWTLTSFAAADDTRTSDVTYTDDAELTLPLGVGTYTVRGVLFFESLSTNGGFRFQVVSSGSLVTSYVNILTTRIPTGLSGSTDDETQHVFSALNAPHNVPAGANGPGIATIDCVLVVTTGGSIKIQWGQSTSNAAASIRKAGSYLEAVKVA